MKTIILHSLAFSLSIAAFNLNAEEANKPDVAIEKPVIEQTSADKPMIDIMAHTCAGCHGTLGQAGDSAFVPLAGMPRETFTQTMLDFRNDVRPSTLMGHVAKGFSVDDIKAMAVYFEQLPPEQPYSKSSDNQATTGESS